MEEIRKQIDKLTVDIDSLRTDLDNLAVDSDEEAEWHDNIAEKLVEAQDNLREAILILDDGPEPADEDEVEDDNPA